MSKNEDLITAHSELGDAAANLSFAGYDRLSNGVRDLQAEVRELIDWQGGEDE